MVASHLALILLVPSILPPSAYRRLTPRAGTCSKCAAATPAAIGGAGHDNLDRGGVVALPCPLRPQGGIATRALGLVMEWAAGHQTELAEDWRRASSGEPIVRIAPLA